MESEQLKQLTHITIGNIIEFASIMKLSIKEAPRKVLKFSIKHKLDDAKLRHVRTIIEKLELYTY